MNIFAEMFRSKASSADPLSPGHDERTDVDAVSDEMNQMSIQ
jgi:hypothetical protein